MHLPLSARLGGHLAVFILSRVPQRTHARTRAHVCARGDSFHLARTHDNSRLGVMRCVSLQRQRDPVSLMHELLAHPAQCAYNCCVYNRASMRVESSLALRLSANPKLPGLLFKHLTTKAFFNFLPAKNVSTEQEKSKNLSMHRAHF